MLILGINAYHAEASAVLVRDGQLVAAAEEERFVRVKHVAGFPTEAVQFCLQKAGVRPQELDAVALSRNPWSHWIAKGIHALRRGMKSHSVQERLVVLAKVRDIKTTLAQAFKLDPKSLKARLYFVEHHRAHIASSFYPSGWEKAVILSLDGFGDFLSGMWGVGEGLNISIRGEVLFPHSLGILYTALTQFLGFTAWGDEYKVMGLAAYGKPSRFRREMEMLVQEAAKGDYRLGLGYFRHHTENLSLSWTAGAPALDPLFSEQMEKLLGPSRQSGGPLEERHSDIAAALQERLETIILRIMGRLHGQFSIPRLCYAGGVALNCVLNGKIRQETPFSDVFIQPAAHDAGTSLGAALYVAHQIHQTPRTFVMKHAAWGPESSEEECRYALEKAGLPFRRLEAEELCEVAADALSRGKILGWFQGRMEFGPRALGHRSLLADPRDRKMKDHINQRIKRRESFRPFAPSIVLEKVPEFFPEAHPDPFMLFAYPVEQAHADQIPAVIHTDGTGRLQAVDEQVDPLYWKLLNAFGSRTGVPVLLNTSFNEQEPIVCRPKEAIACVERNAIDCLAMGPFWVEREGTSP